MFWSTIKFIVQGHKYAMLTRPTCQNLLSIQFCTKINGYLLTITYQNQNLFPDVHNILIDVLLSFFQSVSPQPTPHCSTYQDYGF
jgi:hypothetical protein